MCQKLGKMRCVCKTTVTLPISIPFTLYCVYSKKWYINLFVYKSPICGFFLSKNGQVFQKLCPIWYFRLFALFEYAKENGFSFDVILLWLQQTTYHCVRLWKTYLKTINLIWIGEVCTKLCQKSPIYHRVCCFKRPEIYPFFGGYHVMKKADILRLFSDEICRIFDAISMQLIFTSR